MVYLRSIDPSIEQDMRYAGAHNFTGHRLDGYDAAECVLSRDTAEALARVQKTLQAEGYGLKVFDCYRPSRAVADMGRFATEPGDPRKVEFYPRVDKQDFWRLGYVARVSGHSRGSTVDLTLTGPSALPAATWSPSAAQVDCTAPYEQRWHDGGLDMGTGYDCFDERAHTANPSINATAKANRQRLGSAMEKQGFTGYPQEWWHFTLGSNGAQRDVMDFPITPLSSSAADVIGTSGQLIVVTSKHWDDLQASAQRYQRDGSGFEKVGDAFAVVVGKNGMAWGKGLNSAVADGPQKREGDGKAPAGIFKLGTAFGYDASATTKLPYLALTPDTECVDDSQSSHYNALVDGAATAKDWNSAEHMRSEAGYRQGIFIEHNTPAAPASGSCIFFHIWRGPTSPTAGCTAMDPANISALFNWLDPRQSPLLVQMPEAQYEQFRQRWNLPQR
ncbi:M15 family metallopeptidase [Pseudomonas sp. NPDC086278]|uniref:M15 family metallopeptidase n=1 Tax=Pseudomonas sp. NPDC086278 TaxID=3390646 RepID=UPI003D02F7F3